MGRGKASYDDNITVFKWALIATNLLSWLLGALIFSVGAWIRFEEDFSRWIIQMDAQHYWYGVYVLMMCGMLVMLLSFLGCAGAMFERPMFLTVFAGMLILCAVLELGGAAYTLDNGVEDSRFHKWLNHQLLNLIYRMDDDPSARAVLGMVQYYVGCCGGTGSGDYVTASKETPVECRDPVTGNEWSDGCAEIFSTFMETRSGWISGMALFLCCIQIFMVWCAFVLRRSIIEEDGDLHKHGGGFSAVPQRI